jgi:WLM domain.
MVWSRNKRLAKNKRKAAARKKPKQKRRSKPELVVKTLISPNLIWMYPYLRKAKLRMPGLPLPRRIRSTKPTKTRIMRVLGNAYFGPKTVVLATHNQVTYLDRRGKLKVSKIVRLPKAQILDTLAHELAHFEYPDHGYEHEEFTRSIFKTFELKEKCPYCKGSGKRQLESKP